MPTATDYTTIDAMPAATLDRLQPASRAALDEQLGGDAQITANFYDGGLWGALFGLFVTCQFDDAKVAAARAALANAGFVAPDRPLTQADVLAAMDPITDCRPWHSPAFVNRLLYATALALAANQP